MAHSWGADDATAPNRDRYSDSTVRLFAFRSSAFSLLYASRSG
ncbi:MAG: hypothetical protein U0797_10945 [Gemmataceae bacterium]